MTSDPSFHPQEESLARVICGEATEDERRRVLQHRETCEECARLWRALEYVQHEAAKFDPAARASMAPPAGSGSRRAWRAPFWWGLAAAGLAAVIVYWGGGAADRGTGPSTNGTAPSGPPSSSGQEAPSLRQQLQQEPVQPAVPLFSWSAVAGADAYTVELRDATGERVWTSEKTTGLSLTWPASVEPKAGTYFWRVVAHLEGGAARVAVPWTPVETSGR